jgi:hypothetical protein
MEFFSKKGLARYETTNGGTDWKRLWSDYEAHLDSIRHLLSPEWQQVADADFHDSKILSTNQPSKREFIMDLEAATLRFSGVQFVWVPKNVVGDSWVYWEVTPLEDGSVDLEIRLANDEIRITADDVAIQGRERSAVA